mgnify:CR=1 FL=1
MLTSKNANAKFGQFTASDLSNFKTVIDLLSEQMSAITGLPMRYFGMNTANPAAEGAIRADELRLVKNVELKNAVDGDAWSQVMAVAHKLATSDDINANLVRCDWEDPNTPTYAQRADAITKLMASGILSREGAWDELGWSEARKDKEREYFAKQISESYGQFMKDVDVWRRRWRGRRFRRRRRRRTVCCAVEATGWPRRCSDCGISTRNQTSTSPSRT